MESLLVSNRSCGVGTIEKVEILESLRGFQVYLYYLSNRESLDVNSNDTNLNEDPS